MLQCYKGKEQSHILKIKGKPYNRPLMEKDNATIIRNDIILCGIQRCVGILSSSSSGCICFRTTEVAECDCYYYTISTKHSFEIDDLNVMTFLVTGRGGALKRAVQIQTLLRHFVVTGYRSG
jgi:hypothetical protein